MTFRAPFSCAPFPKDNLAHVVALPSTSPCGAEDPLTYQSFSSYFTILSCVKGISQCYNVLSLIPTFWKFGVNAAGEATADWQAVEPLRKVPFTQSSVEVIISRAHSLYPQAIEKLRTISPPLDEKKRSSPEFELWLGLLGFLLAVPASFTPSPLDAAKFLMFAWIWAAQAAGVMPFAEAVSRLEVFSVLLPSRLPYLPPITLSYQPAPSYRFEVEKGVVSEPSNASSIYVEIGSLTIVEAAAAPGATSAASAASAAAAGGGEEVLMAIQKQNAAFTLWAYRLPNVKLHLNPQTEALKNDPTVWEMGRTYAERFFSHYGATIKISLTPFATIEEGNCFLQRIATLLGARSELMTSIESPTLEITVLPDSTMLRIDIFFVPSKLQGARKDFGTGPFPIVGGGTGQLTVEQLYSGQQFIGITLIATLPTPASAAVVVENVLTAATACFGVLHAVDPM